MNENIMHVCLDVYVCMCVCVCVCVCAVEVDMEMGGLIELWKQQNEKRMQTERKTSQRPLIKQPTQLTWGQPTVDNTNAVRLSHDR